MPPIEPSLTSLPSPPVRWLAATRPGFLGAAAIPVGIGLAISARHVELGPGAAWFTLLGAMAAHAGINVLNDVFDHRSGADTANHDRVFPFTGGSRMIQNGVMTETGMSILGATLLLCAALIGLSLLPRGGWPLLSIGITGLLLGWAYSAPPLKLASRGAGELTVGTGFGLLIPAGTISVQWPEFVDDWPGELFPAGIAWGCLVMLILIVDQFPDYTSDAAAGKRNLVVRLGRRPACGLYLCVLLAGATSLAAGVATGALPAITGIALLPMLLNVHAWRMLRHHCETPARLRPAIEGTLRGSMLAGVVIAASLVAA